MAYVAKTIHPVTYNKGVSPRSWFKMNIRSISVVGINKNFIDQLNDL